MRFFKDKNSTNIAIAILIFVPLIIIAQYYFFKIGIFKPMVKGIEVQVVEGDSIKDIDKFVIKLDEDVTLSTGEYITIPSYSKSPEIWFKELDDNKILDIDKLDTDKYKITGLKEGTSSVGIMKDSRVLKKMNIKVVNQQVKTLEASIDKDINYVGESAEIETFLEVDYERFRESKKVEYISNDENVIKVDGKTINAIGVGKAKVLVKAGDKQDIIDFDIKAKIAQIDINQNIEIGINETTKLQPTITTSPRGLEHEKVKYELLENKLPIQQSISLDKDGTVRGIREGTAVVKITCGNKSIKVNIKVTKEPEVEEKLNLNVDYEVVDNKLMINLQWNCLKDILQYGIHIKNNSLQEKDFTRFSTISVEEKEINESNKVKTTIELDLINGKIPDIEIYVVGLTDTGQTNPSNTVRIKPELEPEPEIDISKETVENLNYTIDEENQTIKLTWNPIDIQDITYSIYIKDNQNGGDGFEFSVGELQATEYSIPITTETLDIDIYVRGRVNETYSQQSNIINIKK